MRERKSLNKALLRKVADKLRRLKHEKHFDQGAWARKTPCGTAACIAGWAVALSGWRLRPIEENDVASGADVCVRGKREVPVSWVASNVMGVPKHSKLFSAHPQGDWPEPFATRWRLSKEKGIDRPSRIAADFLDTLVEGKIKIEEVGEL